MFENFIQNELGKSLPTTDAQRNTIGRALVDRVITDPSTIWSPTPVYVSGVGGQEIVRGILPNGVGVQWNWHTGNFVGLYPLGNTRII